MAETAWQTFKETFESLAGKAHLVGGADEVVGVIAEVLAEAGAKRVALAQLPGEVETGIESYCVENGIDVIKPPFDGATVLHALDKVDVGITAAAVAVADTGALVEVGTNDATRLVSALPLIHIGIVREDAIFPTLLEAAPWLQALFEEFSGNCTATFISGPSRTGDIEMKLSLGVHGPQTMHAIVFKGDTLGDTRPSPTASA